MKKKSKLGEEIRRLRKEQGISADEIAKLLGKDGENRRQYTYDIERGRIKKLNLDILLKLAEILKVPSSNLIQLMSNNQISLGKSNLPENKLDQNSTLQEKYIEVLEENSKLKSQIIDLYKKFVNSTQ